jgi:prolyl oligopeptidase
VPQLTTAPPFTAVEPIAEILHGVTVTDPYRWLEDQESPRTRTWIDAQTEYARSYLDRIPGRPRIRNRIRELLDIETYDSVLKAGERYFCRKRVCGQEQPCIFLRESPDGEDRLLIDPADRGTGPHTAVKPIRPSPDGRLLLYEVKEGGERTGTFEIFDIENGETLEDALPRGYLRGFAFAPDARSFCYVHEAIQASRPHRRAVLQHVLGTEFNSDREVFAGGDRDKLRLCIVPGPDQLGFILYEFSDRPRTSLYLWRWDSENVCRPLIANMECQFVPWLMDDGRILALTDHDAPNRRLIEIRSQGDEQTKLLDVIPTSDVPIHSISITKTRIVVTYVRGTKTQVFIYDHAGRYLGDLPIDGSETVRVLAGSSDSDELFVERESFTKPIEHHRYSANARTSTLWAQQRVPFACDDFTHKQVWFTGKDGTRVPMYLVGRRESLNAGSHPTIMTSYGGYGVPMTPQFSVFVAFMMERGCLFALPNIRGGSEFGREWHQTATRRNRQVAFDDFIAAAEWLLETGRTAPKKLAIFGGSNSGLLVGAAVTQRPELFRAVLCMVPMLDMLRYHLFDNAHIWKEEFGTAEDADDFRALLNYSPYHAVKDGTPYPATMIVSGDADQNCNPLHARKMTARLQGANVSEFPIFLDYNKHRGHSPVLPLSERIEGLTDRMAFLCDQLQLSA